MNSQIRTHSLRVALLFLIALMSASVFGQSGIGDLKGKKGEAVRSDDIPAGYSG